MLITAKKRKSHSLFNKSQISINLSLILFIVNFFIFSANQNNPFFKSIKSSLNLTPYSLNFLLNSLSNGADSVHQYFHFKKTLIQENNDLENRLYLLKNKLLLQENFILDYQELMKKLEIKEQYFDNSVVAKILKINYSGKRHHFLINKGLSDQIQAGNIVVDDRGILGQVIDVQTDQSTVKTIRSKDFYLTGYIMIKDKPYLTLVQGDNQNLTINYFSKNTPIQINDSIYTTGDDLYIPENIRIGKVVKLQQSELKDFYKVIIQPASNPNAQKYLIVLK